MFFVCRSLQVLFSDWTSRTTRICATTYHKLTDSPTRSWLTVPHVIVLQPPLNDAKLTILQDLSLGNVVIYYRNAAPTCLTLLQLEYLPNPQQQQ